MTAYVVYDVFTGVPFGGNQLAVFPDARALPEARLQQIAREFNFSEVSFVYPPRDAGHTARVRIFTPTMEIPFAGHPTIGTAVALAEAGGPADMVLELGVGPVPCFATPDGARFVSATPLTELAEPPVAFVAAALGLDATELVARVHPPVMASVGLPFVCVELTDEAALNRARADVAVLREAAARYPAGLDFALYPYVRRGDAVSARMFAPLDLIPEDPATGSAAAALVALLSTRVGTPLALTIRQGVQMGRPATIHAEVLSLAPLRVQIGGAAVRIMKGTLLV